MKKLETFFTDQQNIFKLGLILHVIVPLLSTGFHHPDEYYYALDFAFKKLTMLSVFVPSWEYLEQIRPWSLPSIFYCLGFLLKSVGVTNPFVHVFFYRLLSSLVAFYITLYFIKKVKQRYSQYQWKHLTWMMLISYPVLFIHARTSSENWSASFFLLTLATHFDGKKAWRTGMLMSVTFFMRFQLAFALLPFTFIKKFELKYYIRVILGFCILSALLIFIDYWGYGKWVLTPYHYFRVNILENKVNSFGVHPWYFYILKTLTQLAPFWGVAVLYSFIASFSRWKKEILYRDILLLLSLFLLIHHLIGHKELRFIYLAFPLLLLPLSLLMEKWPSKLVKVFILANLISLPMLFIPLFKPLIIYKYLYERSETIKEVSYLSYQFPFELKAFMSKELVAIRYDKSKTKQGEYILTQGHDQFNQIKKERKCDQLISSYPKFLIDLNPFGILNRSSIWVLHYCQ